MVAFVWSFGHGRPIARQRDSVRDTRRKKTPLASRAGGAHGAIANDDCSEPSISANGRYVAFASKATNLVRGDDHQVEDVFVRDLKRNRTILVSRARRRPRRRRVGATPRGPRSPPTAATSPSSPTPATSGPKTTPRVPDVFVKDLRTGRVYLASHGEGGAPANAPSASPSISPDGRFVAFNSKATNLSPRTPIARSACSGTRSSLSVGIEGTLCWRGGAERGAVNRRKLVVTAVWH